MAYKQNWSPDEKPNEKDLKEFLTKLAVDLVDTAFLVAFQNDDGGRHAVIMAEMEEDGSSPWKEGSAGAIPKTGWRVMRMTVPDGYLAVFYNRDGTHRKTKSQDDWIS